MGMKACARHCATAGRASRIDSNVAVVRGVITRRAFPILENQSMQDRDGSILFDFARASIRRVAWTQPPNSVHQPSFCAQSQDPRVEKALAGRILRLRAG